MITTIERIDDFGRGIAFVNDKITFIENALPGEKVKIETTKEQSKIQEAKVIEYITTSKDRVESICKNYGKCGGCQFLHTTKEVEKDFKINKVTNAFKKFAKSEINPTYFEAEELGYRNKITLKVKKRRIGFYEKNSNKIVPIESCYLAKDSINKFLPLLKDMNIIHGDVSIRSNYNDELLIHIKSNDKVDVPFGLTKHKVVGIVLNNKVIYGENKFVEILDNNSYQINYNSFFQINNNITKQIFKDLQTNASNSDNLLDLYCGVGTLGIALRDKTKKITGIELEKNAIMNSIKNAKINKIENASFHLGKVEELIEKIDINFDTIIVDPPRAGIDKNSLNTILELNPNQIIYMSCEPITLSRDINILKEKYKIKTTNIYNMFPKTYHVECVVTLYRKK